MAHVSYQMSVDLIGVVEIASRQPYNPAVVVAREY
jgi:hypothetical protein